MSTGSPPLLDDAAVVDYLVSRGVLSDAAGVRASVLGGGVSNVVLAVDVPGRGARHVVVKQALPQLRVAREWRAAPTRALTEADALGVAGRLLPGCVPELIDVDASLYALTIARAPRDWVTWKDALLAGEADPRVGAALGELTGALHAGTFEVPAVAARFGPAWPAFVDLRVDPFLREVARTTPTLAAALGELELEMETRARVLVHGDLSPKNVLVGAEGRLWLLDWEVAHYGDPAFDLAFMLGHLVLKAVRAPGDRVALAAVARAFLSSYAAAVPPALAPEPAHVARHIAALALARVDGKSPVEYLDAPARDRVRRLATAWLLAPPADPLSVFDELEESG